MESKPSDERKAEKKKRKKLLKQKKSRIIIRNLSFKANESIIKEKFAKYGKVIEVIIPKKENGKMFGFAFVGFDAINSAMKAVKDMNAKELLGRTIAVDFALAKKAFQSYSQKNTSEEQIKSEDNSDNNDSEKTSLDIKDEESGDEEEDDDSDGDSDVGFEDIDGKSSQTKKKMDFKQLTDASEEKTIFVRNLSFMSSADSLNELMAQFGETEYCKICIDEETEHSKGTAFVKFKNKSDADQCLKEAEIPNNSSFYLNGRQLLVSLAITRNKLKELQDKRLVKDKDKRNLYLAKEGLIYPESPAAEGVSQMDLQKRLALETKKRKMLQNNHYFISKTRLCIHNLPPNVDNKTLRAIFTKAVDDKKAKMIEVRVMFDRKKLENKFGKSKGFGFVEFNEHNHALKALRAINNNPSIFTPQKRPIVEFSIENRVALNKKKHRLKHNNNAKDNDINNDLNYNQNDEEVEETVAYSGVMSKPNNKNEKIKAPKVNRKLTEMNKKLKVRGKTIKMNKTKAFNEKRHQQKVEKRKSIKSETVEIDDIHDSHYRKRKNVFKDDNNNNDKVVPKTKKRKWFYDTHK